MLLVPTHVAVSAIAGVGLFASEPIARGTLIWRVDPKIDLLFSESEIAAFPPAVQAFFKTYAYPHNRKTGHFMLNIDNGRFMNHSASPNTEFVSFDSGTAIVDIAAGEELTCDYGEFNSAFDGAF